jgi:hypothetical protein
MLDTSLDIRRIIDQLALNLSLLEEHGEIDEAENTACLIEELKREL